MQITTTLYALLALGASAATWNQQLQIWDLGRIPSEIGAPSMAKTFLGGCGGIPEGGHACGSFGPGKIVALRAIYVCVNMQLVRKEVCEEKKKYNRCVKDGRKKGKKFFPFVNADTIVCQKKSKVEKA